MNTPIIRLEVESMKHAILIAFSEQTVKLDAQFKQALDEACKPSLVQAIITNAAKKYIKEALEQEVKSYFMYGDGRKIIESKVKERLDEKNW